MFLISNWEMYDTGWEEGTAGLGCSGVGACDDKGESCGDEGVQSICYNFST